MKKFSFYFAIEFWVQFMLKCSQNSEKNSSMFSFVLLNLDLGGDCQDTLRMP